MKQDLEFNDVARRLSSLVSLDNEESMQEIRSVISNYTYGEYIFIRDVKISAIAAETLVESIKENNNLHALKLSNVKVDSGGVSALVDADNIFVYYREFLESKNKFANFLPKGLGVATEYYNQKYPDRGRIHNITFGIHDNLLKKLSQSLSSGEEYNKVIITLTNNEFLRHSQPFIFINSSTEENSKLILMRNDCYQHTLDTGQLKNMGIDYIKPYTDTRSNPQVTNVVCHYMALGILKDIKLDDSSKEMLSSLRDGFIPPADLIKYSQSRTYNQEVLALSGVDDAPIKGGITTLKTYVDKYKKTLDSGVISSRIWEKDQSFKKDLLTTLLSVDNANEMTPAALAGEILIMRSKRRGAEETEERVGVVQRPIGNRLRDGNSLETQGCCVLQ